MNNEQEHLRAAQAASQLRNTRRAFLGGSAAIMAWAALPGSARAAALPEVGLRKRFTAPVEIDDVDLIETPRGRFIRVTSTDGDFGIVAINNKLEDGLAILRRRIIPFFEGKDAREIVSLIDGVYLHRSNYKFAGMPFWNGVAHVELAILDMLSRIRKCTAGELLGRVLRTEIPAYSTRFDRLSTPMDEVLMVQDVLARRGTQAVKLKVGLRMENSNSQTLRDVRLVELARRELGDDVAIYVDANGSYNSREAIRIGTEFEKNGVEFFEEPCQWEDYEGTREVTEALTMKIAGGEQDTSLRRFKQMIHRPIVDLIQPDVYYCGGLIRSLRVAEVAAAAGVSVCPHNPRDGDEAAPALHLCSLARTFGPTFETVDSDSVVGGVIQVPAGIGLGLGGAPDEWRKANVV